VDGAASKYRDVVSVVVDEAVANADDSAGVSVVGVSTHTTSTIAVKYHHHTPRSCRECELVELSCST
jgi:hypothetical protein